MASNNHDHIENELESTEEEGETKQCPTAQDLTSALQALQNQRNVTILALLPTTVKRRIKALKNLQLQATNIEAKFFTEVYELECKYHKLFFPLYEKRSQIVEGAYEPTDQEAEWPSDDEDDELSSQFKTKAKIEELGEGEQPKSNNKEPAAVKESNESAAVQGIPDFWLTIFKNVNLLAEMIQPHDEPILKHLVDIKTQCRINPMGFTLEFHFAPNDFFTNKILTKNYEMKCVPEEDDPFNFEGPEIFRCNGCTVDWKKGKNVTVKTVKKRQKHKSSGALRHVTKTVPNDSFFNFFSPPAIPDNVKDDEIDDEFRTLLTTDFEIGHYIKERIIPRAVLFFTGEDVDEEDDDFEEDESEEEEDEVNDSKFGKMPTKQHKEECKQQ